MAALPDYVVFADISFFIVGKFIPELNAVVFCVFAHNVLLITFEGIELCLNTTTQSLARFPLVMLDRSLTALFPDVTEITQEIWETWVGLIEGGSSNKSSSFMSSFGEAFGFGALKISRNKPPVIENLNASSSTRFGDYSGYKSYVLVYNNDGTGRVRTTGRFFLAEKKEGLLHPLLGFRDDDKLYEKTAMEALIVALLQVKYAKENDPSKLLSGGGAP